MFFTAFVGLLFVGMLLQPAVDQWIPLMKTLLYSVKASGLNLRRVPQGNSAACLRWTLKLWLYSTSMNSIMDVESPSQPQWTGVVMKFTPHISKGTRGCRNDELVLIWCSPMSVVLFVCSHWSISHSVLPHINLHAAAAELHLRTDVTRGSASPPHTTTHVYLKQLQCPSPLAVAKHPCSCYQQHCWTSTLGKRIDTETASEPDPDTVQNTITLWTALLMGHSMLTTRGSNCYTNGNLGCKCLQGSH